MAKASRFALCDQAQQLGQVIARFSKADLGTIAVLRAR